MPILDAESKGAFRRDGVCVIRSVINRDWCDQLAAAVEDNISDPGPYGASYSLEDVTGTYFADFANWQRFTTYREICDHGPLGAVAGNLMNALQVQLFHEHVLVKEPHTDMPTPWHQDLAVYCLNGTKTVSLWVPLDPVPQEVCPRFIKGSHRDGLTYNLPRVTSLNPLAGDPSTYSPLPTIDEDEYSDSICSWQLEPGDAVAFDFHTLHCAPPNNTGNRRRAVSFRFIGEDCRFVERSYAIAPPFPEMGLDLQMGDEMPEDWFPTVWRAQPRS